MSYAAQTTVPVEKSRAEIESVLQKYGATTFSYGWTADKAAISFVAQDRQIRFVLPLPAKDEQRFTAPRRPQYKPRSPDAIYRDWEQACRQRWRALLLAIKAKLESVQCGISTFEEEFLAHIVDPVTGKTVGESIRPQIASRYAGRLPHEAYGLLLLGGPTAGDS